MAKTYFVRIVAKNGNEYMINPDHVMAFFEYQANDDFYVQFNMKYGNWFIIEGIKIKDIYSLFEEAICRMEKWTS